MTNREWKQYINGLLDTVERQLHPGAPAEEKAALQALRISLGQRRVTQARKPFEQEVDRLIESRPFLLAAAHRHIGKILPPALELAAFTLKKAQDLLDRMPDTPAANGT